MKIIAIADTHGYHQRVTVPQGDVLIVAGDICPYGIKDDIKAFSAWLQKQPCKHKIIIAGNHDKPFERENSAARQLLTAGTPDSIYLQDESIKIKGITFYGSPWTPTFMNWYFMANRGEEIREKWDMIPEGIDVLITHGPPATILDNVDGIPQGCSDLMERVVQVRPKFHLFGHIHEGYGRVKQGKTTFINASSCDGRYRAINEPISFAL